MEITYKDLGNFFEILSHSNLAPSLSTQFFQRFTHNALKHFRKFAADNEGNHCFVTAWSPQWIRTIHLYIWFQLRKNAEMTWCYVRWVKRMVTHTIFNMPKNFGFAMKYGLGYYHDEEAIYLFLYLFLILVQ